MYQHCLMLRYIVRLQLYILKLRGCFRQPECITLAWGAEMAEWQEFKVWRTWCSDGEFKPAHHIIPGSLILREWAENRLGPALGGPSRTLPSGNQLPYPAYTSWVSRVDVQFVDATCWQQHVGAALDKRKLVEDVGLGTSKSVCEGSGLPVTIRSNPEWFGFFFAFGLYLVDFSSKLLIIAYKAWHSPNRSWRSSKMDESSDFVSFRRGLEYVG